MALPPLGTDRSEWLDDRQLILRHGTSLRLMSQVTSYLNDTADFNEVDPTADWEKWTSRRPDMSLYFAAILDPTQREETSVRAVLRAVLDGVPQPRPPHRSRLIIDYVHTRPEDRGQGLASLLIDFVKGAAQAFGANTYVLATEDACVYWLNNGFVLETGEYIKARLAVFPDCHLLRRQGEAADLGSAEDLELVDEEGEGEGEGGDEGGDEGGGNGEGGDAEESDLQAAIAASLAEQPVAQTLEEEAAEVDDEEELRAAIAMSLQESV